MPIGMTFADISGVLSEINALATGREPTSEIIDTSSFVSVAEATLRTGYDNVMNAISQVLTRTIFAVRPYNAMMTGLEKDGSAWGNHVRKINFFDQDPIKDTSWSWPANGTTGTSSAGTDVDPFIVQRPSTLQTNFYGSVNYSRLYSEYTEQLKATFRGPDELAAFWTAFVQHMSNQIDQDRENLCLNLVGNYAAGMTVTNPSGVIYLLDEYNAETGKELTATTVYAPENFPDFARYAYARIQDVSDMMTRRTINWHQNWNISSTDYNFMRHTPRDRQHLYLFSQTQRQINARVLSDTFNQSRIEYADYSLIPYWQNPDERAAIQAKPIYTSTAGAATISATNVGLANVFGILFDDDAIGYTPIDNTIEPIRNPRSRYTNFWYHYGFRFYNDFTENAALFLLTSADVTAPAAASMLLSEKSRVVDKDKV